MKISYENEKKLKSNHVFIIGKCINTWLYLYYYIVCGITWCLPTGFPLGTVPTTVDIAT